MNQKGKIKNFQLFSLAFFLTQSMILGVCVKEIMQIGRETTWLAVLFGSLVGYLLILLYFYIHKHQKDQDILDYNISVFGTNFGVFINKVLNIALILLFLLALREVVEFINLQFLVETPSWALEILFGSTIIIACLYGLETLSKTVQFFFIIIIVMIVAVIIGVGKIAEISNLKPIFEVGLNPFIKSSVIAGIYTAFPVFMLLVISPGQMEKPKKAFKSISIGYGLGAFINVLSTFLPISIFGINLALLYDCPNYAMVKKMNLFTFVERIENVVVIIKVLPVLFLCMFLFYFIIECLKKTFRIKKERKRNLVIIVVGVTLSLLSGIIFSNDTVANEWLISPLIWIVILVFVLLPAIVAIKTFLINRK